VCSETLACKLQTPVNIQDESIQQIYHYSFPSAPYSSVISCWHIRPVWGHGSRGLTSVTPLGELKIFCFNLSMPLETVDWKTKDSQLNDGKQFPYFICSATFCGCKFDLFFSFPHNFICHIF
jgi:hypothetical protein